MKEKLLLLGDQAIALGAIHAGIAGVYAYPGTPSTEITEYIQEQPLAQERKIHSRWCANEKTAMEAALGVSYIGKRALVCMKHVGLNVAADAFVNSSMTGTNGGLVVLVADDPSMHSSQNEQDSRFYGKFAFVPVFEPSSQQEAYDMIRYAFEVSEKYELPVLVRLTTRMAHSRAEVVTSGIKEQNPIKFPEDKSRWVLLPVNARRRYNELLASQPELEKLSTASEYNSYKKGNKQGVIACGIGYNYLMENFPQGCDRTVLKISQYPLPKELIRKVMDECDEVLILEDGQPFVEEQLRGLLDESGKVKGRLTGELPRVGELTPDNVRAALGFEMEKQFEASKNIVPRPPALCSGCGHSDVYKALNEVVEEYKDAKVFSDIGCYTLGALPPFRAIDTCVDMGASITMAKGAADGGLFPSVAVIGDSTFTHSGITGLLDAVNSKANITVVISDNLTTAMTGGQDSAGTEKLEEICYGIGVEKEHVRVVIPLPKNMDEIKSVIKEEIEYKGVSVIIPRRECIQTLKRKK
ncbi:indolepyruvate ferredoxin oxidoreductase alpha subunit [Dysgonomonas hofstadii]|uniref:Indolepyruvate oxidoreductase subunit IorA n=1 Tax=Dysgonomonas hofstadii TaxID=637886 RepID=A0A840CUI3_9BACT|nr:thiamine pyrophosphate-dependent enzyme [Dysgonomonas hofstadii]MBB4037848.1 indolepyruvate ferredoxin oxidoreductase alpha subunit [Dysgonomonas hofstadii]